ncbi:hypothetical protein MTO96_037330 [Rhipicephalus appendiculatus]
MATATRDLERRALYRVTNSVRGVNGRPTLFADEATLNRYACWVCHVLPSTTIVLPCSHGVCRQCQVGCVDTCDGRRLCPMDGEPFGEDDCQESKIPARKKQDLKVCTRHFSPCCDFWRQTFLARDNGVSTAYLPKFIGSKAGENAVYFEQWRP